MVVKGWVYFCEVLFSVSFVSALLPSSPISGRALLTTFRDDKHLPALSIYRLHQAPVMPEFVASPVKRKGRTLTYFV